VCGRGWAEGIQEDEGGERRRFERRGAGGHWEGSMENMADGRVAKLVEVTRLLGTLRKDLDKICMLPHRELFSALGSLNWATARDVICAMAASAVLPERASSELLDLGRRAD
jgi:hypothetical protein